MQIFESHLLSGAKRAGKLPEMIYIPNDRKVLKAKIAARVG